MERPPLVALVAGATRGAGHGIACALGEIGATVCCSGRSEYGFADADASRPHWGRHWEEAFGDPLSRCDDGFYSYWTADFWEKIAPEWP